MENTAKKWKIKKEPSENSRIENISKRENFTE